MVLDGRSWPISDACNGRVYDSVAKIAIKKECSDFKTACPQSRRDEDQKVDLEEINLLRRQSILPFTTKPNKPSSTQSRHLL